MAFLTVKDVHATYGPCRVKDANGDFLLGSIVEVDLESGVYVVIKRRDDGQIDHADDMTIRYERCEALAPLKLVPISLGETIKWLSRPPEGK